MDQDKNLSWSIALRLLLQYNYYYAGVESEEFGTAQFHMYAYIYTQYITDVQATIILYVYKHGKNRFVVKSLVLV